MPGVCVVLSSLPTGILALKLVPSVSVPARLPNTVANKNLYVENSGVSKIPDTIQREVQKINDSPEMLMRLMLSLRRRFDSVKVQNGGRTKVGSHNHYC